MDLRLIARDEGVSVSKLERDIKLGHTVILCNNKRNPEKPCAVGRGLRTKVNVNIGTSPGYIDLNEEEEKIRVAERFGADTIMDLSTGGDIDKIRRFILSNTKLPVGTVPIYQAAIETGVEDIFDVIQRHAEDGVDFMTVHCGVTLAGFRLLKKYPRVTGIVSRGGAILCSWMNKNKKENPLFSQFDKLLDIAKRYDIVLSLGDGMRPGCIKDASDKIQIYELRILAQLAKRAKEKGVQVIIEGPGHLPINHIEKNIRWQKKLCHGAPFYVLGPLVTDTAPGYDHITSAIGGALAASYGADFLCYVTPAEHLRLPTVEDVVEGLIASKIAAHAGDIAKGIRDASKKDLLISIARAKRDWQKQIELAINPDKARDFRQSRQPMEEDVCTMCGEFCSMKMMEECTTRV